mmetsp:Transcript_21320/g.52124  ORF Transcript_21320/g.52124 Transcript_21320/m.52124 type:complete len:265 (+) Transcript_21320:186-980(+)
MQMCFTSSCSTGPLMVAMVVRIMPRHTRMECWSGVLRSGLRVHTGAAKSKYTPLTPQRFDLRARALNRLSRYIRPSWLLITPKSATSSFLTRVNVNSYSTSISSLRIAGLSLSVAVTSSCWPGMAAAMSWRPVGTMYWLFNACSTFLALRATAVRIWKETSFSLYASRSSALTSYNTHSAPWHCWSSKQLLLSLTLAKFWRFDTCAGCCGAPGALAGKPATLSGGGGTAPAGSAAATALEDGCWKLISEEISGEQISGCAILCI